jgi:hypothetical protein
VQAAGSISKAFKVCRNLPTKASHWPVELDNFETKVPWPMTRQACKLNRANRECPATANNESRNVEIASALSGMHLFIRTE